jgi:peptidoglycan/xylan/chitin deacetylase (PgdA/CDA1 family)
MMNNMSVQMRKVLGIAMLGWAALAVGEQTIDVRGGLVLQFDDGWTAWRTELAPELARWGGKATAFVNTKYLAAGRITREDLKTLQDEYGWEIGTHTVNHYNAPRFARQHGVETWVEQELLPSIRELAEAGLDIRALVFPFNESTPELETAALKYVDCFRRRDRLAITAGLRADRSFPATSIDSTQFTPLPLLKQWVDLAHRRGELLFLYGHRVLPDDAFTTGKVVAVENSVIVVDTDVVLQPDEEYALVPDMERRTLGGAPLRVLQTENRRIIVDGGDLAQRTHAGAVFLIGPSYGTRLSEFRELISYAADRLRFYTVSEVLEGRHRQNASEQAAAPP